MPIKVGSAKCVQYPKSATCEYKNGVETPRTIIAWSTDTQLLREKHTDYSQDVFWLVSVPSSAFPIFPNQWHLKNGVESYSGATAPDFHGLPFLENVGNTGLRRRRCQHFYKKMQKKSEHRAGNRRKYHCSPRKPAPRRGLGEVFQFGKHARKRTYKHNGKYSARIVNYVA